MPSRAHLAVTALPLALGALPALAVARVIARYGLDVPHMDQWELVPVLRASIEGRLTLAELAAPHNEHRLLVPRLVMLGLARLTAWDIRTELWLGLALAVGAWALAVRLAWRTVGPAHPRLAAWLAVPAALLAFAPTQWHNWLWGWQLQIFLNVLGALLVAGCLSRPWPGWPGLAAGIGGASLATWSFASGLLLFPLLALALAILPGPAGRPGRTTALALVLAAALPTIALHVAGLPPGAAAWVLERPGALARYALAYLGAPLGLWSRPVAVAWGAAGLVLAVGATLALGRRRPRPALLPWLCLAAYAAGSAGLSALGRLRFGEGQALASRYVTISSLLWLATVALTALACGEATRRAPRAKATRGLGAALLGATLLLAAASGALAWRHGHASLRRYHATHLRGLACVQRYVEAPDDCLGIHYPDPAVLRERARWLEAQRLTLFGRPSRP